MAAENSTSRIQTLMALLGPAVHPSECAFRSIDPVTKGPVLGNKLPVSSGNNTLKEITKLLCCSSDKYNKENTNGNNIGRLLESGRSRFAQHNYYLHDTTFVDTMNIVHNGKEEKEKDATALQMIWSQHINNLPMPKSIYLTQEPDNLDKIYRQSSSNGTNFTNLVNGTICKPRAPQLGQKSESLYHMLSNASKNKATKPMLDLKKRIDISKARKKEDYALRLDTMPFTKLFSTGDNNNAVQIKSSGFIITLDPTFDPLEVPSVKKRKPPIGELLTPLNEMCSAGSISERLHLPGRKSHDDDLLSSISHLLPHTRRQFDFLNQTLKGYRELRSNEEQLLDDLELMSLISSNTNNNILLPRKICLETDIELLDMEDVFKPKQSNNTKKPTVLGLPSLSGMMSAIVSTTKTTDATNSKRRGRNYIQPTSIARVSNVDALQNAIVNPRKASCLFLPQTNIQTDKRKRKPTEEKTVSSSLISNSLLLAIRSSVPIETTPNSVRILQAQCSGIYPVAPWFESENTNNSPSSTSNDDPEIKAMLLNLKRKKFCQNARARSNGEGSRTLLLTGCSSRRNATYKYGYRGFITNQTVNPSVFQSRYNAMLQVNKLSVALHDEMTFFFRMALGIFAVTRHKDSSSKKSTKNKSLRSAPFAIKLNTKRHGKFQISANSGNGTKPAKSLPTAKSKGLLWSSTLNIDALGTEKKEEEHEFGCFDALETLGQQSLKNRGELLHLVAKVAELEGEKKSYLAESRDRVNTPGPGNVAFEDLDSTEDNTLKTVDFKVHDDDKKSGRKRKAENDLTAFELKSDVFDDCDDDKETKKRKKKKKKKKKEKRKKKRKHGDVGDDNEPKKCKVSESKTKEEESNRQQAICELPTMTPINPFVKKKAQEQLSNNNPKLPIDGDPENVSLPAQDSLRYFNNGTEVDVDSNPLSTSSDTLAQSYLLQLDDNSSRTRRNSSSKSKSSPDSVAELATTQLNPGIKPASSDKNESTNQLSALEENHPGYPWQHEKADGVGPLPKSQPLEKQLVQEERQHHTQTILTSESFLETFGEVITELASGRWQKAVTAKESSGDGNTSKGIVVCDCPLLDITGADIELADASAIIVQHLSSWVDGSLQNGGKAFIRRLVNLAANGRYNAIHVILCLDVEMSSQLSAEITTLQNAVMASGCPCEYVTFEYVSRPRSIAASIALRALSVSTPQESSEIAEFVVDEDVHERARLLVTLIPSITLHAAVRALNCLSSDNIDPAKALHSLFFMAKQTTLELFTSKMEGILSSQAAAQQLWMALNIDVSQHAF